MPFDVSEAILTKRHASPCGLAFLLRIPVEVGPRIFDETEVPSVSLSDEVQRIMPNDSVILYQDSRRLQRQSLVSLWAKKMVRAGRDTRIIVHGTDTHTHATQLRVFFGQPTLFSRLACFTL